MMQTDSPISDFLERHFRHFNAAALVEAARGYRQQLDAGHPMMVTMAGAMSTAQLGKSLAEMIRQNKVQIICCTGANLEEDLFNLVAHHHYERIPDYRNLTAADEQRLYQSHMNRVTDTCIPEEEAMRCIERELFEVWERAHAQGKAYFPHEYFFQLLRGGALEYSPAMNPDDSWLLAAAEKDLPIIVPGWEDSTCGNFFAAFCLRKVLQPSVMKSGIQYMMYLADWYQKNAGTKGVGFFQIGGGIAGDFPICVVPMLHQDLRMTASPKWSYFCQISDSTTSYGSYSGAAPNEKITWGKLGIDTPKHVIESDATIVAPLIFAYVLGW